MQAFKEFFTFFVDFPLVLQVLCVSAATVLCLGVRVDEKRPFWVLIIDGVCLAAAFFVLDMLCFVLSSYARWFTGVGTWLVFLLGIAVYAVIRSRHTVVNRIAMGSIVFSISLFMAILGTILGNAIAGSFDGFDIAVTKIISYLIIVGAAVLFYKFPLSKFEENRFEAILNIVCNAVSATVLIIYDMMTIHNRQFNMAAREYMSVFVSIVTIALLLINIATYFTTYFRCRERQSVLEYRAEAQNRKTIDELLALSEHSITELREVRHDVKNQYAYMQVMIEEGRYDDLKKYFDELIGTFAKPLYSYIDSGNKLIDSILNLELNKAAAFGIKLTAKVAVPDELPFKRTGLLGLITNVIDNAIDACVREKATDAVIEVECGIKGDYFVFVVSNPTVKTSLSDKMPVTEKKDKLLHGHGIRIINKIVNKYNGNYNYQIKDGKFIAESMLDLKYDSDQQESAGEGV